MNIPMLLSKIHGATVTMADLEYEGSIGIARDLMDAAGLLPSQRVSIYNITNGNRLDTYVITLPAGSGRVEINGAAAHLAGKGDNIIIAAYVDMPAEQARTWSPWLVFVDASNGIKPQSGQAA